MARRPSKAAKLPGAIRELIAELHGLGWTLDQIAGALRDLTAGGRPALPGTLPPELTTPPAVDPDALPSRSGLHRHIQGLDRLADRMARSRTVAEALVRKLGDAPEDRTARLNIELMHSAILDLFMGAEPDEDGVEGAPVTLDPESAMLLARAIKDLSSAKNNDAALVLKLREQAEKKAKAEAAKVAESAAREGGATEDQVAFIRARILGIQDRVERPGHGNG
jgi:hypothetical protein